MKKFLFTFLVFLLGFNSFAQLDTEHWFAPMFDRASSSSYYANSSRQYIFLSTNETTPFDVEIYSGNTLITTIKGLSKGNPKNYSIAQKYIISKNFSELGKVSKKGLYLKASKKFFANLRFSTFNHAEILTSKGQAGVGMKFYAVVTPISHLSDILNFSIGILATEDNTKIKVSGYDSNVRFSNISPTPASIEITLNKGESYILEGGGAYDKNRNGVIGAKIEADKPVGVTNGNFNGQYAYSGQNSDIIMDQSVPVDRLGNEFVIVKGNGTIGTNMEGAIIVATEDNTEIYINNDTNPITTLNEGEYYVVSDTKFVNRRNGHYNLYVKSTRNIYLYQLLGGTSRSNYSYTATAGFNYIPPLNCFLPKQVGEIGMINTMYGEGRQGEYYTIPTKLNFITMRGAVVNVENYTLTPQNGPFDVDGTSEWVTYSIPDVKGNINITSTKSITAGISAGDKAVGYGGYFAGFSTVLSIKRRGNCIPNITLEIEGDYDAYQWKKNGVDIVGATSKVYTPIEPGKYSVKVGNDNCFQTTAEVIVPNCMVETVVNEAVCGSRTFVPSFKNSTQVVDLSTLKIINQPTKGIVSIDNHTGNIIYTPNVGQTGVDSFSYQFSGKDSNFPDTELVTVNLELGKFALKNAKIKACKENGKGVFDLTSANLGNIADYTLKYYSTMVDAENETNEIPNPKAYSSVGGKVYVKAKSNGGCLGIVEISLEFYDLPIVDIAGYNATHCDINFDGKVEINFPEITKLITSTNNIVKYYLTQADAQTDTNALPDNWFYSVDTDVYVRVISPESCFVVDKISFKIKDKLTLKNKSETINLCDANLDGNIKINFKDYHSLFTTEAVSGTYYETLLEAQNGINALPSEVNVINGKTYYLRLENSSSCPEIVEITFNVSTPQNSTTLKDVKVCSTNTTILDAGAGFVAYQWSTGATSQSITAGIGEYWVDLTSVNGCIYRQFINVTTIEVPRVESVDIKDNTAIINVVGGSAPYEYSLNGGAWQTSNIFTNLVNGSSYQVAVRSQNGCEATYYDFSIIKLINLITPNGDGINDVIDYSYLKTKANPKFNIYDRYGALVFEGNTRNQFIWDGKANGRPLPTATYWYLIEWQEPNTNTWVKNASWILLKNRD